MNKYEGFIGKVLDGRYKILELVGLGGMACVLKAQDLVMNRIVAIKILNDEYNGNEAAEARFIDESKAVAMLSNKNIVGVYDVAIYPDIKYIVMEYLDGITLREYLDNKGVIGWKEACIYVLQILRALEHAHSKGIIHRDIKPQNVMLMKNGDIKVTDFGIAKLPDSVSEQTDEKAVGTVYYISPEQACGKETDYYSDIYSVGIMFYEAVTGTLPFTAETPMEVAMMQVNDEPVHPRDIIIDIPVGVSQIILKAMEKSPSDRFQSAHTMVKAIEWVLRYPDVIFAMDSAGAEESPAGSTSVVSIDMISTAEIEPYGDEEIADSIDSGKSKESGQKQSGSRPKKKKRRKSNKTMFPIISAIALAFLIAASYFVVAYFDNYDIDFSNGFNLKDLIYDNRTPEEIAGDTNNKDGYTVEYPDIVGEIWSNDLVNTLRNGKYKVVILEYIEESHEDLPYNYIIETYPEAGEVRKIQNESDPIYFNRVVVNRPSEVTVPDLVTYPKSYAKMKLSELDLKIELVETSEADNPYYYPGQVVKTTPEYGQKIKAGETVTVYIYAPAPSTTTLPMPNVVGMTQQDAIKFAQTYAGYTVEVLELPTDGGDNRVVEQSIAPGLVNGKGTVVTVTVATPIMSFVMPDLDGKTYEEVVLLMNSLSPDIPLNITHRFYSIDESVKPYFEVESANITDEAALLKLMKEFECTELQNYDGIGTVYFQSQAVGVEVSKTIQNIDIIYITYTIRSGDALNEPDTSTPTSQGGNESTVVTP